jgi:XTP/dITP diphosphohydrolase
MNLYFVSGSKQKFAEVQAHIPEVKWLQLDLDEVQSLDPHVVIQHKIHEARNSYAGDLLVEDTSLYLDCLNGMPGPLIKWFLVALEENGLYKLAARYNNFAAKAMTVIGLFQDDQVTFFEGVVSGKICPPAGPDVFGWDTIFQPRGHTETFAELGPTVKNAISMRHKALAKLQQHLRERD